MIRVGLTGSIGMGKSTTADIFRRLGVPVHDSDAIVHRLYAKGGAAVAPVAAAFSGVIKDGAIDRTALSKAALRQSGAIQRLEHIVHPLVYATQAQFIRRTRTARKNIAVFDIPLLFETNDVRKFDCIIVVTAPASVQRGRVLARAGMDTEKFQKILARQVPDKFKRSHADYVIQTGLGKRTVLNQVRQILRKLGKIKSRRRSRS